MPYLTATEELTDAEVMAHAISFSEMEGNRFDWDQMQFERRDDA